MRITENSISIIVPTLNEAPLFADTADFVVGSHYVKGGSTPGWPVWRWIMSRTGAVLAYPLTGLHDSMCVFFAIGRWQFGTRAAKQRFQIVFETMMRAPVERCAYAKFPIVFRERVHGKSKMSFGLALGFFLR